MLRAVLFDMDGVVADTEEMKARAHVIAATELGGNARPDMYEAVIGESFEIVRDTFVARSGAQACPDAYLEGYSKEYARLLGAGVQPVRGVNALIDGLLDRGVGLAIVTSSERWAAEMIAAQLGLQDVFAVCIANGDFARPKPAPDPYLAAMRRLGCTPEVAVAIEDTRAGIDAAVAAGIPVIALRHRLNRRQAFAGVIELASLEPPERVLSLLADAMQRR